MDLIFFYLENTFFFIILAVQNSSSILSKFKTEEIFNQS